MRIRTKTIADQMKSEPADKVLSDLEAKHGSTPPSGYAERVRVIMKANHPWKGEIGTITRVATLFGKTVYEVRLDNDWNCMADETQIKEA